jgi:hypothetical protein
MQTDLLHGVSDVGPCKDQVLESPYNALKLGSIRRHSGEEAAAPTKGCDG